MESENSNHHYPKAIVKIFQDILKGGDLRSIEKVNEITTEINTQNDFDELMIGLSYPHR